MVLFSTCSIRLFRATACELESDFSPRTLLCSRAWYELFFTLSLTTDYSEDLLVFFQFLRFYLFVTRQVMSITRVNIYDHPDPTQSKTTPLSHRGYQQPTSKTRSKGKPTGPPSPKVCCQRYSVLRFSKSFSLFASDEWQDGA